MSASWLYDVNIWILGAGSIAVFLACAAAGQWIGYRFRSEETESALSVTRRPRRRRSACLRS